MDGKVNFFVDLKKYHVGPTETDELCHDLKICKKKFVKYMVEFKDKTGLTKLMDNMMDEIKNKIAENLKRIMTHAKSR